MADEADPVVDSVAQDGGQQAPDKPIPLAALQKEREKRQAAEAKAAERDAEIERIKAAHAAELEAEKAEAAWARERKAKDAADLQASNDAILAALPEDERAEAAVAIDGLDGSKAAQVLKAWAKRTASAAPTHPRGVAVPSGDPKASTLTPEEKAFKARTPFLHSASDSSVKASYAAKTKRK
jgi:hypothetical protein